MTFRSGAPLTFANAERLSVSANNPFTVDSYSIPGMRAPGINKWDLTVQKSVFVREGVSFKLRAELYNAFNRTHFGTPNTTVTSGVNFGRITGTFLNPRETQLSGRFTF